MYTWSSETLGREEEKGIVEGKTAEAEGGKAGEGRGRFTKTLVVITPTLSNGIRIEEGETETRIVTGNHATELMEEGTGTV